MRSFPWPNRRESPTHAGADQIQKHGQPPGGGIGGAAASMRHRHLSKDVAGPQERKHPLVAVHPKAAHLGEALAAQQQTLRLLQLQRPQQFRCR